MNSLTYLILFASVILGAVLVELFKVQSGKQMKLFISFSGAYLFAITILHLIPEIYHSHSHNNIGLYILLGFFIQIILEHFSQGIEHGHSHLHGNLPLSMMLGLCIHAFMEGMPLGGHHHGETQNALLTGIVLHKVPVSIVLVSMFLHSGMNRRKTYLLLLLFAIMTPLGTFTSNYISEISNYYIEIMAIVIGIFLHISTTILFETSEGHRFNGMKFVAILVGTLLALAL